jgi:hypothetical protein
LQLSASSLCRRASYSHLPFLLFLRFLTRHVTGSDPLDPTQHNGKQLWAFERKSRLDGGYCTWTDRVYRIKHLPTRKYLCVERTAFNPPVRGGGDGGAPTETLYGAVLRHSDGPESEFVLHPTENMDGEHLQTSGVMVRIQHVFSKEEAGEGAPADQSCWLHNTYRPKRKVQAGVAQPARPCGFTVAGSRGTPQQSTRTVAAGAAAGAGVGEASPDGKAIVRPRPQPRERAGGVGAAASAAAESATLGTVGAPVAEEDDDENFDGVGESKGSFVLMFNSMCKDQDTLVIHAAAATEQAELETARSVVAVAKAYQRQIQRGGAHGAQNSAVKDAHCDAAEDMLETVIRFAAAFPGGGSGEGGTGGIASGNAGKGGGGGAGDDQEEGCHGQDLIAAKGIPRPRQQRLCADMKVVDSLVGILQVSQPSPSLHCCTAASSNTNNATL